jgi:hypothetical protein
VWLYSDGSVLRVYYHSSSCDVVDENFVSAFPKLAMPCHWALWIASHYPLPIDAPPLLEYWTQLFRRLYPEIDPNCLVLTRLHIASV